MFVLMCATSLQTKLSIKVCHWCVSWLKELLQTFSITVTSIYSVPVVSKLEKAARISESLQRLLQYQRLYKKTLIRFWALKSNHVITSLVSGKKKVVVYEMTQINHVGGVHTARLFLFISITIKTKTKQSIALCRNEFLTNIVKTPPPQLRGHYIVIDWITCNRESCSKSITLNPVCTEYRDLHPVSGMNTLHYRSNQYFPNKEYVWN